MVVIMLAVAPSLASLLFVRPAVGRYLTLAHRRLQSRRCVRASEDGHEYQTTRGQ